MRNGLSVGSVISAGLTAAVVSRDVSAADAAVEAPRFWMIWRMRDSLCCFGRFPISPRGLDVAAIGCWCNKSTLDLTACQQMGQAYTDFLRARRPAQTQGDVTSRRCA